MKFEDMNSMEAVIAGMGALIGGTLTLKMHLLEKFNFMPGDYKITHMNDTQKYLVELAQKNSRTKTCAAFSVVGSSVTFIWGSGSLS